MTPDQMTGIIAEYLFRLRGMNITSLSDEEYQRIQEEVVKPEADWSHAAVQVEYLVNMLTELEEMDLKERWEKANRWIGFIQGVLWAHGIFSIDQMKDHNR